MLKQKGGKWPWRGAGQQRPSLLTLNSTSHVDKELHYTSSDPPTPQISLGHRVWSKRSTMLLPEIAGPRKNSRDITSDCSGGLENDKGLGHWNYEIQ